MGGFEAGFGGNGAAAGGGQTREHAQLARSLGIDQLAVVISKLDTCCFSQVLELPINAQTCPELATTREGCQSPGPHILTSLEGPLCLCSVSKCMIQR